MRETRIGAFTVTRVEEMLTPGFDPAFLFPEFDPAIYDEEPMLAARHSATPHPARRCHRCRAGWSATAATSS